jgi:hypothetical protein
VRYPGRCKLAPNVGQGWVKPVVSVRMHRTAGARAADARVRSDRFGCVRTICVGPRRSPNMRLCVFSINLVPTRSLGHVAQSQASRSEHSRTRHPTRMWAGPVAVFVRTLLLNLTFSCVLVLFLQLPVRATDKITKIVK